MTIDDIQAGADTVMTADLIRLFRYAGCNPTKCHACQKHIKAGETFRLVPHKKAQALPLTDEMCCASCGALELEARDSRELQAAARLYKRSVSTRSPEWAGGYSRVSKT